MLKKHKKTTFAVRARKCQDIEVSETELVVFIGYVCKLYIARACMFASDIAIGYYMFILKSSLPKNNNIVP